MPAAVAKGRRVKALHNLRQGLHFASKGAVRVTQMETVTETVDAATEDGVESASSSVIARLRTRMAVVLVSHTLVDIYAQFIPPIVGLLEVRCELNRWQAASLLGFGSVSSGLSQPTAAWLSDRFDSRLFAPAGLAVGAVCLSCIGLANSFATLLLLYITGMIGVGMYHPVGASSVGHLSEQLGAHRRSMGVSFFFVAGMVGGISGAMLSPWITARPGGFDLLRWMLVPGVIVAAVLLAAIRRTPHRDHSHRVVKDLGGTIGRRWRMIIVLYFSNAMRFTTNMALFYLYVRWAQSLIAGQQPALGGEAVARDAAPIAGRLVALTIMGMALGGLTAGSLVRAGRERWPMVLTPLLMAPFIALFPFAGLWGGYGLAICAGVGFASMIPVTISLSQRLLPHRTSLASGLMMGGAWTLALTGPLIAEWMMTRSGYGLRGAFVVVASILATSGLLCTLLDTGMLRATAARRNALTEPGGA